MKTITKDELEKAKANAIAEIENLYDNTDLDNLDDCKRTYNYYRWIHTKTNFIMNERQFSCRIESQLKRGTVVWVDFGFNMGNEFGGKHPAIILRKSGQTVFVVPLSSQEPSKKHNFHVKVDKVYGMTDITRWTNVLKLQNVSIQRIDENSSIGNVKGDVLDAINDALKKCHIF